MTTRDPDDPIPPAGQAGEDEEKKPRDLRFTRTEQSGIRIERDLSGQGHLARGSRTNMSNMRFSVRAQPRDERDPELQALRTPEPPPAPAAPARPPLSLVPPAEPTPAPAAERESSASPAPAAAPSSAPPASEPQGQGIFAAIKRLFS